MVRVSVVPREARAVQGHRAGVCSRLVAAVIDAALVGAGLALGYASIAGFIFMLDPRSFAFPRVGLVFNLTVALVVTVIYLTVAWRLSGRSYGKVVMGLRVIGHRGDLRLPASLVRAVACVLFPVGLLWCAVNPDSRSLQDMLLRTSVLYDW